MSVQTAAPDDTTAAGADSTADPSYFADVDDVVNRFADAGYLADQRLASSGSNLPAPHRTPRST